MRTPQSILLVAVLLLPAEATLVLAKPTPVAAFPAKENRSCAWMPAAP